MYKVNKELEEILKKFGFIEATTERDKIKGKKEFRLSKNARKKIYFDYINIRIVNSFYILDSTTKMDERKLKSVLLYFILTTNDFKELSINGAFSFTEVEKRLASLYEEIERVKELDVQKQRQQKISRILRIYESIVL